VALRRTNLWVACVLVLLAAFGGLFATNANGITLSQFALLYTVSESRDVGTSVLALAVSAVLPFVTGHHSGGAIFPSDLPQQAEGYWPYVVLVWFAGRAQARRHAASRELERGLAELDEERERLSRSAVAAERSRIARDLQALVVRGVERMDAESRASRELLSSDSTRFSETVGAIESTGRSTLVEMRRLLAVLRTRDAASAMPRDTLPPGEHLSRFAQGDGRRSQRRLPTTRWSSRTRVFSDSARRWLAIPWVVDGALVLVLAVLALTEPLLGILPVPLWPAVVVVAVLLLRRRFPLVVLLIVASVVFVSNAFLTGSPYTADRSLFLAVFTVAQLRGPVWSIIAAGAPVIAYAPLIFIRPQVMWPYDLAGFCYGFLFAVIGGIAVRSTARLNAELRDQSDLLRRTREERVRLVVDEERTRIARDVHDLVAHAVTLMVIQAGAARWLAESDPLQADQALSGVERAGEEALRELHSLVGLLGSMATPSQPFPTDEQLTIRSALDREVDAGMDVELAITGAPRELDAGLGLSVCRIVQEALTNVRKHAPGARAWVVLRYTPEGVEVEVTDTGGGTPVGSPSVPGAGHGLVGIAERAGLFGGRAEAGPTPEGGFRVRATLHEERVLV
jgi:signal transduction histidine kinase